MGEQDVREDNYPEPPEAGTTGVLLVALLHLRLSLCRLILGHPREGLR